MVVLRENFCANNLFDEIGGIGAAKKALLVWTIRHSSHHSVHFSLVGLFVVFKVRGAEGELAVLERPDEGSSK